jgi:membrane protease YdiL (CAAX protease family)
VKTVFDDVPFRPDLRGVVRGGRTGDRRPDLLASLSSLARSCDARTRVRQQFGTFTGVLPHTRTELRWFGGVSLTAGFCEEFLYRGYFIWVFAPWLGWWGAAALSLPFFAGGHAYQGWKGVWPAIGMHAVMDLGAGGMAWLALRDGAPDVEGGEGERTAELPTSIDGNR